MTMYKVPSPFNSPFAKAILTIFWCAYVGMLVALIVDFDINLFIIAGWWTFVLPWLTWSFLSGVQVEPGKRVGGGPMYPRGALEPAEVVVFNAPIFIILSGGHVFITDRRIILLPIRFYGGVRRMRSATSHRSRRRRRASDGCCRRSPYRSNGTGSTWCCDHGWERGCSVSCAERRFPPARNSPARQTSGAGVALCRMGPRAGRGTQPAVTAG